MICIIPQRNMLSTLRDYFYRGVQRTDRELRHMVQQKSPEAQYQQNQHSCEKTTHLKMLVLQTHLSPGNIEDAYSHYSLRSPKMSVINSIPDQIVNMVTMVAQKILNNYNNIYKQ